VNADFPLRVGIIGCGNVVINSHIPALLRSSDVVPVAVSDPVESRRALAMQMLDLLPSAGFASHQEMIANQTLDYVVLATPPALRLEIIGDCAQAGVHVLAEKPIAVVPHLAIQQAEMMQAAGCTFGFVHNYLFYPEYVQIRNLIVLGELGSIRHITLNFLGVPDKPGNQDYHPNWRHIPGTAGGGILMDMIHAIYLSEHLMGSEILAVSAVIDNLGYPGGTVEDLALVHLYFENGYTSINMGWGHGPGGVEVTGSEGRLMAFYRDFRTGPFDNLESMTLINNDARKELPVHSEWNGVENFQAIHENFSRAIRNNTNPIAPASVAIRSLEAALAAYTAALQGQVIELPFAKTHPVYLNGVAGLDKLPARAKSAVVQRNLFQMEK
jgi:predicted dehydrogenase